MSVLVKGVFEVLVKGVLEVSPCFSVLLQQRWVLLETAHLLSMGQYVHLAWFRMVHLSRHSIDFTSFFLCFLCHMYSSIKFSKNKT